MKRPMLPATDVRRVLDHYKLPVGGNQKVVVLGVRGYYLNSQGERGRNDRGIYDDAFFVALDDRVVNFNGNTDPSAWRRGIATLKTGTWTYIAGVHGLSRPTGGYAAFRQFGRFTVTRDGIGEDTGEFAINFHRGGSRGTSSEGCQTVPPSQWLEFRDLIYRELGTNAAQVMERKILNQFQFTYLLIEKADLDRVLGRVV